MWGRQKTCFSEARMYVCGTLGTGCLVGKKGNNRLGADRGEGRGSRGGARHFPFSGYFFSSSLRIALSHARLWRTYKHPSKLSFGKNSEVNSDKFILLWLTRASEWQQRNQYFNTFQVTNNKSKMPFWGMYTIGFGDWFVRLCAETARNSLTRVHGSCFRRFISSCSKLVIWTLFR